MWKPAPACLKSGRAARRRTRSAAARPPPSWRSMMRTRNASGDEDEQTADYHEIVSSCLLREASAARGPYRRCTVCAVRERRRAVDSARSSVPRSSTRLVAAGGAIRLELPSMPHRPACHCPPPALQIELPHVWDCGRRGAMRTHSARGEQQLKPQRAGGPGQREQCHQLLPRRSRRR